MDSVDSIDTVDTIDTVDAIVTVDAVDTIVFLTVTRHPSSSTLLPFHKYKASISNNCPIVAYYFRNPYFCNRYGTDFSIGLRQQAHGRCYY